MSYFVAQSAAGSLDNRNRLVLKERAGSVQKRHQEAGLFMDFPLRSTVSSNLDPSIIPK